MTNCVIIGAGMAGLLAGYVLQKQGIQVTLLDKGHTVGGRMATRHFDGAMADHGAQFFTVRSPIFGRWVEQWQRAGVVQVWCHGFSANRDGHPRYRGATGMTAVPRWLAHELAVYQTRVIQIQREGKQWQVASEMAETFTAEALIMTPPVPQTLALLESSELGLPQEMYQQLKAIHYDPCLALLVTLDGPSRLPTPGAIQVRGEPIDWVGDNRQKGISDRTAVTIHASADFSRRHFQTAEAAVTAQLLSATYEAGWFKATQVRQTQLKRWRYAQPQTQYPTRHLLVTSSPPLLLAGDAFGEARVEGAALSGLSAAKALLALI